MTRNGRARGHRSKKKRITLALAPVAALAVIIPLMNQAGAATSSEVSSDCTANSDKLESCEFVDVQFKRNNLGPNERVSTVSDNCAVTTEATKTFSVTTSVTRTIQTENGSTTSTEGSLGSSLFEVGGSYSSTEINIKRDETATGEQFSRTDTIKADHIAFFMWSAKRTDVSGYLKATYKEEQDGQKVFFSPSEGGTSVHVFYPQLLDSGTPDGRLWLRNVKCGTDEANGILNSGNSIRTEPGFGEGGPNVTDVEVPLSEIHSQGGEAEVEAQ